MISYNGHQKWWNPQSMSVTHEHMLTISVCLVLTDLCLWEFVWFWCKLWEMGTGDVWAPLPPWILSLLPLIMLMSKVRLHLLISCLLSMASHIYLSPNAVSLPHVSPTLWEGCKVSAVWKLSGLRAHTECVTTQTCALSDALQSQNHIYFLPADMI